MEPASPNYSDPRTWVKPALALEFLELDLDAWSVLGLVPTGIILEQAVAERVEKALCEIENESHLFQCRRDAFLYWAWNFKFLDDNDRRASTLKETPALDDQDFANYKSFNVSLAFFLNRNTLRKDSEVYAHVPKKTNKRKNPFADKESPEAKAQKTLLAQMKKSMTRNIREHRDAQDAEWRQKIQGLQDELDQQKRLLGVRLDEANRLQDAKSARERKAWEEEKEKEIAALDNLRAGQTAAVVKLIVRKFAAATMQDEGERKALYKTLEDGITEYLDWDIDFDFAGADSDIDDDEGGNE